MRIQASCLPPGRGSAPGAEGGWAVFFRLNSAMKRRILVCLLAALLLALGAAAVASAETASLKFAMELSDSKFTGPKEITISIKITNAGEADMPGPVTLYDPSGKQVEEFGAPVLAAGAEATWSGKWNVTQSQLDAGKITFKIRYALYSDEGELVNKEKAFSRAITYAGEEPAVEVRRTIAPTTARKGQEVSVTYEVANTGNVEVTNVVIKENNAVSTKSGKIDSIPAGEKKTYTFTTKMGTKNITSAATVTYKAGGKNYTVKKESASIKYGEVKLSATLKADKKGGAAGDTVKLTLTLKNTGKVDYHNVSVTDATLGEVFSSQSVAAGKTLELTKELTITDSMDLVFTVKGEDSTGGSVETATSLVRLTAISADKKLNLAVEAEADRQVVYELPGTVKFHIRVTNNGGSDIENVTVSASGVSLYTFPKILAGETREFTRDVSISMAGQYRFDAKVKNQLEETETFQSNVIQVGYEAPTAAPTEAPLITPPQPVYEPIPSDDGLPAYVSTVQGVINALYWVFLVLAVAALALLAVGVVRRVQIRQASKDHDHLDGGSYRVYTEPAEHDSLPDVEADEPVERPIGEDRGAPDVPEMTAKDAEVPEDGKLMEETLRKLYPRTGESLTIDPTLTVEGEEAPEAGWPEAETLEETSPEATLPETEPAGDQAKEAAPRRRRSARYDQ